MRLLIVGGKLQGTEAAYLAGKAGMETVLVDRREAPPAAGLADVHIVTDITADEARARSLVTACDAVLPACEDEPTLAWLARRVPAWGVPLLFDLDAYHVTESKLASRRLFADLDVPRPADWPGCGFPVVVKPSTASGSEGVTIAHDEDELSAARASLLAADHEAVVEEYVDGPSLSIEVLAWGGRAVPLQVTGLEFDTAYDCRRVVAPVGEVAAGGPAVAGPGGSRDWEHAASPGDLDALDAVAVRLAEGLGLRGLMDVEVMLRGGESKVLEIDARLPSQTPTAVYWSSGLNMVQLLAETVLRGGVPDVDRESRRACVYQHLSVSGGFGQIVGEHVMAGAGPLRLVPDFFGVDEALTDYRPGVGAWSATLIATAPTAAEALGRARRATQEVATMENIDLLPEMEGRGRRGVLAVTRLTEGDVGALTRDIKAFGARLEQLAGIGLRDVALRTASDDAVCVQLYGARVAAVPISTGEGLIPGFGECVVAILEHLGCEAWVAAQPDVRGIQDAVGAGAEVVFIADDHRFIALNVTKGRCVDDDPATADGYVTVLEAASGGLFAREVLLLGLGPVGRAAARRLLGHGAKVLVVEPDAGRLEAALETGLKLRPVDLARGLAACDLIFDATPAADLIDAGDIGPDTIAAVPGLPSVFTAAAQEALGARHVHEPLAIGVAVMAARALM